MDPIETNTEFFNGPLFLYLIREKVLLQGNQAISVAVVDENGTRADAAFYTRDGGRSFEEMASETPFRLASISKTITSAVVLALVDDGLVSLDDRPLKALLSKQQLDCPDQRFDSITVRMLLSHTSGIAANRELFFDELVKTPEELLERICSTPLESDPGSRYRYSNANYLLLTKIIEEIAGAPYESVVASRILDPKSFHTFVFRSQSTLSEGEPAYYVEPGSNYMELLLGAGAWSASSSDLARFFSRLSRGLGEGGFLSKEMLSEMFHPATLVDGSKVWSYGLGIRFFENGSRGHTGTIESVKSLVIQFPTDETVAILINGDFPAETDSLIGLVEECLFWAKYQGPFLILN